MEGIRIVGGSRVEVVSLPKPEVRPGWVLIKLSMSAVCGSDLHHYRMDPTDVGSRADRIAGHEAVGVVEEIGSGVVGLQTGTRVVVYQHAGCGLCEFCRSGEPMFCAERRTLGNHIDGADAEYLTVPAAICQPLPDSLSDEVGTLISCSLGTAVSGVRKLHLDPGDTIVVFGLGPVGCCAVVAAGMVANVVAVDPVPERRQLAESLGASLTIDPTTTDVMASVLEHTGGRGAQGALDSSGNPGALSSALDALRPNGRLVVLAATRTWSVDPGKVRRSAHSIIGSWVYGMGEFDSVVSIAEQNATTLESIVTRRFAVSEANEAFKIADESSAGKVVINW